MTYWDRWNSEAHALQQIVKYPSSNGQRIGAQPPRRRSLSSESGDGLGLALHLFLAGFAGTSCQRDPHRRFGPRSLGKVSGGLPASNRQVPIK